VFLTLHWGIEIVFLTLQLGIWGFCVFDFTVGGIGDFVFLTLHWGIGIVFLNLQLGNWGFLFFPQQQLLQLSMYSKPYNYTKHKLPLKIYQRKREKHRECIFLDSLNGWTWTGLNE
jgi:hypothetical protein